MLLMKSEHRSNCRLKAKILKICLARGFLQTDPKPRAIG